MNRVMLIFFLTGVVFGCSQQSGNDAATEEGQTLVDARSAVKAFTDACERADSTAALRSFADNGKFICVNNGVAYDYKSFRRGILEQFASLESQDYTVTSEQFQVMNSNSVLYTLVGSDVDQLKNGVRILVDPLAATLLLEKINNEWKIVYLHESATINIDSTQLKR